MYLLLIFYEVTHCPFKSLLFFVPTNFCRQSTKNIYDISIMIPIVFTRFSVRGVLKVVERQNLPSQCYKVVSVEVPDKISEAFKHLYLPQGKVNTVLYKISTPLFASDSELIVI